MDKKITFILLTTTLVFSLYTSIVRAEVVVIVSANSSVSSANKSQVSDIFLGKASAFASGERAIPIEQSSSAQHDEFHSKITGKSNSQLRAYWSRLVFSGKAMPPTEATNSSEVKKMVSENPNRIGYVDKDTVDGSVKVILAP